MALDFGSMAPSLALTASAMLEAAALVRIARHLVEKYPEHGFIIDYEEAAEIGLAVKEPTNEQAMILDRILPHLPGLNAFGKVVEI